MRLLAGTIFGLTLAIATGLWVTRPQALDPGALAGLTVNPENGALVFAAMGCASCHTAPDTNEHDILAGGRSFKTEFGTYYAPNISSDPDFGIGDWSDIDIATSILKGTSPDGRHYYPVFPYASYTRTSPGDIVDLIAHLRSLPASQKPNTQHDITFPFNIRATLGGWKLLFLKPAHVVDGDLTAQQARGRYLVETLGHCGECHTPRNLLGGMKRSNWLAGAADPSGSGRIPDIRPARLRWTAKDLSSYLKTGLTPDYDSAGGEMVAVIKNTSQLPDSDRDAIAAYLLMLQDE